MKNKRNNLKSFGKFFSPLKLPFLLAFFCVLDMSAQSRFIPNDPLFSNQWNLGQIWAPEAWTIERGNPDVLIFELDEGTQWYHPDLVHNIYQNLAEDADHDGHTIEFINNQWVLDPGDINGIDDDGNGYVDDLIGWNFFNNNNDPSTGNAYDHGTKVAGIIAAEANNSIGVAGTANQCKIVPLSIFTLNAQTEINAINYAVSFIGKPGISRIVLNCSWSYSNGDYAPLHNAIINARNKGAVICFASGNEGNSTVSYPARYPECIAVGATTENDQRATAFATGGGSNYGPDLDICTPGWHTKIGASGNIYTTNINGTYTSDFGCTSAASPQAAAAVALELSQNHNLNPWEVQEILQNSADKTGGYNYNCDAQRPGFSMELGYGRLNVFKALLSKTFLNETEPNDTYLMDDGPLKPNMLVTGTISSSTDADWYWFELISPDTISITILGTNKNWALYSNPGGNSIANGNIYTERYNTKSDIVIPAGRYYVKISSTLAGPYQFLIQGNLRSDILYEAEPNVYASNSDGLICSGEIVSGKINPAGDIDWYWFEAKAPGTINIMQTSNKTWQLYSNYNQPALTTGTSGTYTYNLTSAGRYYIKMTGSTGSYDFTVNGNLINSLRETEYNSAAYAADGPISNAQMVSGKTNTASDVDWFYFDVIYPGNSVTITMNGDYKSWSAYKDPAANEIGHGSTVTTSSTSTFNINGGGRYYISVSGYQTSYYFSITGPIASKSAEEKDITSEPEIISTSVDHLNLGNYPNPLSQQTTIHYTLDSEQNITLKVYDLGGKEIKTLVNERKPAGYNEEVFDASGLRPGVYFYQIQTKHVTQTKKMSVIR
jgi:hypothetical protein